MSNRVVVEVKRLDDEVLVLAYDNHGKTFLSYEPDYFEENFSTVPQLLKELNDEMAMEGAFFVGTDDEVVVESSASLEVHGFKDGDIEIYYRDEMYS